MTQGKISGWKEIFWPIHRSEIKKFLSMFLLLFFLCTSYSILRNLKETVIIMAESSGAEVIPFLKTWGMLPAAIIATFAYTRLCRFIRRTTLFYLVISFFLIYFLLFAFVFYPNHQTLHLNNLGDFLSTHLPKGFSGLIAMIRNWTFTLFYVISELWTSVVLTLFFWGFANDVTTVEEGKRSYGFLNIGSNIAPIFAGSLSLISTHLFGFTGEGDAFHGTIIKITLLVTALGVIAMGIFAWMQKYVPEINNSAMAKVPKENYEKRLSIRESIRYLSNSPYLLALACIVLGYNVSINLTDILWKAQMKKFFTTHDEMMTFMNCITIGIGVLATLGALFFSVMIHRIGWTFVSLLTPLLMAIMGIGFFGFMFLENNTYTMIALGVTPLAFTVYFGALQNCLSKAGKYSLFDATKEMAFLPLDSESKLKGKAAIDGLGSVVGKSGASLTYQGLLIFTGSITATMPYVALVLLAAFSIWFLSVFRVGKSFKSLTTQRA